MHVIVYTDGVKVVSRLPGILVQKARSSKVRTDSARLLDGRDDPLEEA